MTQTQVSGQSSVVSGFIDVAVPLPIFQTFTYALPEGAGPVAPGSRVLVPFGARHLTGIALRRHEEAPAARVKLIERVLDDEPLLSPQLLELSQWLASYYFAPPGEALRVMLPGGLLQKRVSRRRSPWPAKRQLAILEVAPGAAQLTPRQSELMDELRDRKLPVLLREFTRETGCSTATVQALVNQQVLRVGWMEIYRSPWAQPALPVRKHVLNEDQRRILERIQACLDPAGSGGRFHSMLIHGITGSGKTEIYVNAIAAVLAQGKSALMLVPEIGLTPQVSRYFRGWFGEQVAILHSGLSDGERFDQWQRVRQDRARVVVGTRSAVFAPLRNLGIIIVDEEHDTSYKQEELPRYNARDTALKRGQIEKALVILGGATPQLETYYQAAVKGRWQYEVLASRILERSLPAVHIVDMRVEFEKRGKAALVSDLLKESIHDRLAGKEQVLVLMNRRGYSTVLLCRSCGHTETCENCSISLTYHQDFNRLFCHYCNYSRSVPRLCRECGKEYMYFWGEGTEKVQEALQKLFPRATVDRLDRDTVQRKGGFERILGAFASGRTDILIGTQMIAKGHDFPGVTLVGVLAAEQGLKLPDFRAAERTFQLLTQVAGRAGRGERPGDVIIQTYYPNHYSLRYACAQDYRLFFEQEIEFRRAFQYPPFTALANLVIQGSRRARAWGLAQRVGATLLKFRSQCSSPRRMRLLGPASAALERLKGDYRFQILIKTTNRTELHDVLARTVSELREQKASLKRISIDIDPLTLL